MYKPNIKINLKLLLKYNYTHTVCNQVQNYSMNENIFARAYNTRIT